MDGLQADHDQLLELTNAGLNVHDVGRRDPQPHPRRRHGVADCNCVDGVVGEEGGHSNPAARATSFMNL